MEREFSWELSEALAASIELKNVDGFLVLAEAIENRFPGKTVYELIGALVLAASHIEHGNGPIAESCKRARQA